MEKRALFDGKILPAAELSAVFRGNMIEVLGYGINISEMKSAISENYLSFHDKQIAEAGEREAAARARIEAAKQLKE